MTQQPESTDPIASAGQIDDPDQPTTVKGQDDSRAGRDTQPDESSADGDPDQPGAARHTARPSGHHDDAARAAFTAPGATTRTTSADMTRGDRTGHDGKPPKAIQETGVPVMDRETAQARDVRDVDSEALAGTRKFQPRPGDANPNVSDNPADFPDHRAAGGERAAAAHGEHGQGEAHAGRERNAAEHVAGPRGGAPDGAVRVSPESTAAEDRATQGRVSEDRAPETAGDHRDHTGEGRARDGGERAQDDRGGNSTAQYETPESIPAVEPVRHSRLVEERVQEQERDYDLGTTEEGERYLTPKDLPGA